MIGKHNPQKSLLIKLSATILVFVSAFLLVPYYLSNLKVSADIGGLVSKINEYRIDNGLSTLNEDQNLVNAACWLASDHAANDGSGHIDSLGRGMSERLASFGVSGTTGENVARWTDASKPATYAFDLWKDSPGHNALMLEESFTRIGVGSTYGSGWQHMVANFADGSASSVTNQCSVSEPKKTTNTPVVSAPAPKKEVVRKPTPILKEEPKATESTQIATSPAEKKISTPSNTITTTQPQKVKGLFTLQNATILILFLIVLNLVGLWWVHKRKHWHPL